MLYYLLSHVTSLVYVTLPYVTLCYLLSQVTLRYVTVKPGQVTLRCITSRYVSFKILFRFLKNDGFDLEPKGPHTIISFDFDVLQLRLK